MEIEKELKEQKELIKEIKEDIKKIKRLMEEKKKAYMEEIFIMQKIHNNNKQTIGKMINELKDNKKTIDEKLKSSKLQLKETDNAISDIKSFIEEKQSDLVRMLETADTVNKEYKKTVKFVSYVENKMCGLTSELKYKEDELKDREEELKNVLNAHKMLDDCNKTVEDEKYALLLIKIAFDSF